MKLLKHRWACEPLESSGTGCWDVAAALAADAQPFPPPRQKKIKNVLTQNVGERKRICKSFLFIWIYWCVCISISSCLPARQRISSPSSYGRSSDSCPCSWCVPGVSWPGLAFACSSPAGEFLELPPPLLSSFRNWLKEEIPFCMCWGRRHSLGGAWESKAGHRLPRRCFQWDLEGEAGCDGARNASKPWGTWSRRVSPSWCYSGV